MATNLTDLCSQLDAKLIGSDATFTSVSIDSRTLKPGDLFVAVQGENFDGHDFIQQVEAQGAVAAIVSRPVDCKMPLLQVADTRLALGKLAALHRQKFQLPIIALTGSCGKTTVKEMLRSILTQCGSVLASQGTLNNDIGVPLTLLQLTDQHRYAVIEIGANHPGEVGYLTKLVKPQVAFINNVAPAHLEGFGSIEGVAKAKAEIFQGLPADGIALINADDNFASWIEAQLPKLTKIRFGIQHEDVAVTAQDIVADDLGYYGFVLKTAHDAINIKLPVLGKHNVLNAVAAATAAQAVGAGLTAIKQGLEAMAPVKGRLVMRSGLAGSRIFDDSYNANPFSVAAALRVLATYPGERIFVMGDMGELGPDAENHHRAMGVLAKELGIEKLYAYGKLSSATVQAFGTGAYHFATQAELSDSVRTILQAGMTVLVKGSRSAKMENVVAALMAEKF